MGGKVIAIYCVPGTERSKLLQRLFEEESLNLKSTITTTSRKPRIGERDGLNYHFITAEEFKKEFKKENSWNMKKPVRIYFMGQISASLNHLIKTTFLKSLQKI